MFFKIQKLGIQPFEVTKSNFDDKNNNNNLKKDYDNKLNERHLGNERVIEKENFVIIFKEWLKNASGEKKGIFFFYLNNFIL